MRRTVASENEPLYLPMLAVAFSSCAPRRVPTASFIRERPHAGHRPARKPSRQAVKGVEHDAQAGHILFHHLGDRRGLGIHQHRGERARDGQDIFLYLPGAVPDRADLRRDVRDAGVLVETALWIVARRTRCRPYRGMGEVHAVPTMLQLPLPHDLARPYPNCAISEIRPAARAPVIAASGCRSTDRAAPPPSAPSSRTTRSSRCGRRRCGRPRPPWPPARHTLTGRAYPARIPV